MKVKILFILLMISFSNSSVFAQESINKFDENGARHGRWKGFYEGSKKLKYEGEFSHGKETGMFRFYEDTKANSLIATREFNLNDNSCFTVFYSGKNRVSEGIMVNRKPHGEWKYYHKNSSNILSIENYIDGKLTGIRKVYFKDTVLAEESQYKDGLRDGYCKIYNNKGNLLEYSNYVKGELHGVVNYYNTKGNLSSSGQYKNHKACGKWTYYADGKIVKVVNKDTHYKKRKKKSADVSQSNSKSNK
jgi:antitoxin component YwqK of YwqJK toxin-antitoxin module